MSDPMTRLSKAIRRRLRECYRTLDPVALLAEIRAAQHELGERIGKRGLQAATSAKLSSSDPLAFARSLGTAVNSGEVRATHRKPKHRYKTRIRMPSKLDPHLTTIDNWLEAEPQITALAILQRLATIDPASFSDKPHPIVYRLLRTLRRTQAQTMIAAIATSTNAMQTGPPSQLDSTSAQIVNQLPG
jgi:hypothetical protein